jgi:hypothetical protein
MTEEKVEESVEKKHKIVVTVDHALWLRLWDYIKKKYQTPWRVYSKTIIEALTEYLDKHEKELEAGQ